MIYRFSSERVVRLWGLWLIRTLMKEDANAGRPREEWGVMESGCHCSDHLKFDSNDFDKKLWACHVAEVDMLDHNAPWTQFEKLWFIAMERTYSSIAPGRDRVFSTFIRRVKNKVESGQPFDPETQKLMDHLVKIGTDAHGFTDWHVTDKQEEEVYRMIEQWVEQE